MDFRKSFSRPFKKLKDKLPGGSRKRDDGGSVGEDEQTGSRDSRKGRVAEVEGSEAGQKGSSPHSEVRAEGVVEGGPGQEGSNVDGKKVTLVDVDPPKSASSIPHIGEPDSA